MGPNQPLACPLRPIVPPAPNVASRPHQHRRQRLSVKLREQTRAAHRGAEAAFDIERRLVDRPSYSATLLALRAFYAPAEAALAALVGWDRLRPMIDIAARRRTALLDEDL